MVLRAVGHYQRNGHRFYVHFDGDDESDLRRRMYDFLAVEHARLWFFTTGATLQDAFEAVGGDRNE